MIWDRDRWYLAGREEKRAHGSRLWRADRVTEIAAHGAREADRTAFDVRTLLGRRWLRAAMHEWRQLASVTIRLSPAQAARLRRDWYYRHARFERVADDAVVMTFGEDDRATVLELVRWLGPGAELLEPAEWRDAAREELQRMIASYTSAPEPPPSP
jgi:predicted DNA-binding transcriptional regulator YafY